MSPSDGVVTSSAEVAAGIVENVAVIVWRGVVDSDAQRSVEAVIERTVRHHPENVSVIIVVEPTSPPPSAELRTAGNEMLSRMARDIRSVAGVIEGDGLRASLVRSVMTGIAIVAARQEPIPMKFFGSTAGASMWTTGNVKTTLTSERLTEGIEAIRDAIGHEHNYPLVPFVDSQSTKRE